MHKNTELLGETPWSAYKDSHFEQALVRQYLLMTNDSLLLKDVVYSVHLVCKWTISSALIAYSCLLTFSLVASVIDKIVHVHVLTQLAPLILLLYLFLRWWEAKEPAWKNTSAFLVDTTTTSFSV